MCLSVGELGELQVDMCMECSNSKDGKGRVIGVPRRTCQGAQGAFLDPGESITVRVSANSDLSQLNSLERSH